MLEHDVLDGLRASGDRLVVLTWLHRARRDILRVHPRDDVANPLLGVFGTRSADRPNPIGLHEVEVIAVDGDTVRVRPLRSDRRDARGRPQATVRNPTMTPPGDLLRAS